MSDYRKQSILRIIAFFATLGLNLYYFYHPGNKVFLIFIFVIAFIYLLIEMKFYFNLKNFILGLIYILSIISLIFVFASFFINSDKYYIKLIIDLDIKIKLLIIIASWTFIWQFLFVRLLSKNFIFGFFKVNIEKIDDWKAIPATNDNQGTDIKEIDLNGKLLRQLAFSISSESTYWRAGFKIVEARGQAVPLRSSEYHYILFHLGSDNGKDIGLYIYDASQSLDSGPNKTLILPNITTQDRLIISVTINEKNFIQCFVNNKIEYETRIDSNIRKKAYMLAWGDGSDYEVDFKNISFEKK